MRYSPKMFIRWIRFFRFDTEKMRSESGFTLLELILVLVVTSILSSALVMPFLSNLNDGVKPDIYATATQLAAAELEDKKAQGFAAIVVGTVVTPTVINGRSYTKSVATQYVDYDAVNNEFDPPVTNDYIMATATVTEAVSNTLVVLETIITPDYN
jgi:prepilin-type N-terminal cleavage/methylation domain-containing protein